MKPSKTFAYGRAKHLFLCLMLCTKLTLLYAQPVKNMLGFEGVPWGSSVSLVKSKFPRVTAYDACKNAGKDNEAQTKDYFAKNNMSCTNYSIDKYYVDGVDFNLIFSFTSDNKLRSVSFDKSVEGDPSTGNSICRNAFSKLNVYMKKKHGVGQLVSPELDLYGFRSMGFQNHEAEVWSLGATQVYLSNSWNLASNPNFCWVSMNYSQSNNSASTAVATDIQEIKLQCRIQGTEQRSFGYFQKFDTLETITYTKRGDGAEAIVGSVDGMIPPVGLGLKLKGLVSATNKGNANLISIENVLDDGESKSTKSVAIDRNTGSINFYWHRKLSAGYSVINGSGVCDKVDASVRKF